MPAKSRRDGHRKCLRGFTIVLTLLRGLCILAHVPAAATSRKHESTPKVRVSKGRATMDRILRRSPIALVLLVCVVGFVRAGGDEPLSAILPQFFVDGVSLDPVIAGHEAHFLDQGDALGIMAQIDATLAAQFATYPLTSSSGAFTYTLDPETGQPLPTSESFGPIFAERPETLGRRKANVGVTSLNYHFDKLEGFDLDSGRIVFTLFHEDTDHNGNHITPSFEGDVIDSRLFLDLRLSTTIAFANFGITDRLDLGIAVPYVRAKLDATTRDTILPVATVSGTHQFSGGALVHDFSQSGRANGVGDVVLRGKYNFKKGFAGAFDLRLPTGDEKDLLGSGATQLRLLLIARGAKYDIFYGGLYPHINLGYTISEGKYSIPVTEPPPQDTDGDGT